MFAETDESVNKKTIATFEHGLTPIVCCGETLEERESGKTFDLVAGQVTKALAGLTEEQVKATVIAYEPIGLSVQVNLLLLQMQTKYVRTSVKLLQKLFLRSAEAVRIQYGGSVKPKTLKSIWHNLTSTAL